MGDSHQRASQLGAIVGEASQITLDGGRRAVAYEGLLLVDELSERLDDDGLEVLDAGDGGGALGDCHLRRGRSR